MAADEYRRAVAERGHTPPDRLPPIDPTRYPLLHDKLVRGLSVTEMLSLHNCRSRSTLASRLRSEVAAFSEEL